MILEGRIVTGHGAASGMGKDPRYPEGTLHLQIPHFRKIGIDISNYYPGTINVHLGTKTVRIIKPKFLAKDISWSPHIPPENFFFFDVWATYEGQQYQGLIYMPDPATKTDHFQDPALIELLLPEISGIKSGKSISLRVEDAQIEIR